MIILKSKQQFIVYNMKSDYVGITAAELKGSGSQGSNFRSMIKRKLNHNMQAAYQTKIHRKEIGYFYNSYSLAYHVDLL